jgi:hypothetical protein
MRLRPFVSALAHRCCGAHRRQECRRYTSAYPIAAATAFARKRGEAAYILLALRKPEAFEGSAAKDLSLAVAVAAAAASPRGEAASS